MDNKLEADDKPIVRLDGLHNILEKYDAFILDQYGVMHNGAEAYPGAVDCYDKLYDAGKKIIILSNLGERCAAATASLGSLGFDPDKLTGFVCSGEEAWHYMRGTKAGKRCTVLTWAKGADAYISGLDLILSDIEEADFILCHGTDLICTAAGTPPVVTGFKQSGDPAPYAALLQRAAARGLEMVVANPDIVAIQPDGSKGYMPGAIGRAYEKHGGHTMCFGKPHLRSFETCVKLAAAAGVPSERVVHVGDSAEHDVIGATTADIDVVFVGGGIHAAELGLKVTADGDVEGRLHAGRAAELLARHGCAGTWTVKSFCW